MAAGRRAMTERWQRDTALLVRGASVRHTWRCGACRRGGQTAWTQTCRRPSVRETGRKASPQRQGTGPHSTPGRRRQRERARGTPGWRGQEVALAPV